jgi:glycosyltransferase involved in cell wall biosynthesis
VAKAVVAIPVRDEAERIGACLAALNLQSRPPDAVVLMLNNCSDATEAIVHAVAPRLRFALDVVSRDLPAAQAGAGHARRLALQIAAKQADYDSVLLTTDADAVVPPDWIARNLHALESGGDIVCGRALIDPLEAIAIPAHLHADDARECRLITLLDTIAWVLDPEHMTRRPATLRPPAPASPCAPTCFAGSVASPPCALARTAPSCALCG